MGTVNNNNTNLNSYLEENLDLTSNTEKIKTIVDANTQLTTSTKELIIKISELYDKAIEIMEQDRKLAIENYNILKELVQSGDDRDATKQQLNESIKIVIDSSKRLKEVIYSIGRILVEIIRAISQNKKEDITNFRKNFFKDYE